MEARMGTEKVAVVTGVSSGIGRATALGLVASGFRVFGTVRSATASVPEGVERVVLDVSDEASALAGVKDVLERAGHIDVLVNNAGAALSGAIEETDTAQAQRLFDVNFFGVARVTRAVLPSMRARGEGRVILVSSVVGFLPAPFLGFYSASKHALEGYGESLDHEVRGFGIRVVLVEPGFMKTRIDDNATRAAHPIDAYAATRERVSAAVNEAVKNAEDPSIVADAIVRAATIAKPKLRYTVGKGTGTLATLRNLVPAGIFDKSFRSQFKLD
jgi:NAD(P)-dependent dehydrogenase (short-subunit alcohol dehydrogenase family)